MKGIVASFVVVILLNLVIVLAHSQTRQPPPRSQYSPLAAQQAEHPQQQRQTWYEAALSRLNPDNVDYGAWMEQRRRAFLEATVKNRYFNYALAMTLVSLLLLAACAKLWNDGRRKDWITAEMMTDLLNQDRHSREVAREAIRRYNDHIERCNRVIEAAESGHPIPGSATEAEQLRAKVQETADQLSAANRQNQKLKLELEEQKLLVAQLSIRTDAVSRMASAPGEIGTAGQVSPASSNLDSNTALLMEHINRLQAKLYTEQKKNERLKGR